MKKVKIMLTAIVVLAIAGGALAFKTTTFNQEICINTDETPTTTDDESFCSFLLTDARLTDEGALIYATLKPITLEDCTTQLLPNGLECPGTFTEDDN